MKCKQCSKEFTPIYRSPQEIKKRKTVKHYCSRKCFYKAVARPRQICPTCNKSFDPKRYKGHYTIHCSSKCMGIAITTLVVYKCIVCGKEVLRQPTEKQVFCSNTCLGKQWHMSGHPQWKGGRYKITQGKRVYWAVSIGHGQYRAEHRIVVEKIWGRRLDTTEIVLHVNGDDLDNRVENLYVTKGVREAGKILHGGLPWPTSGNVLLGLHRQDTDRWGLTSLQALDDLVGGNENKIHRYVEYNP